ncbi:MAG: hypothetical protein KatS3mg087_0281 [Patescibacteria group bacterium]|nr:MAG: hypothetical protein KatS3mg087_0281 [Patescibacteria group bacterium]
MDTTIKRRNFTPKEKLQVVLESYQRDTTIKAICRKYNIVRSVVNRWREEFQQGAENAFIDKRNHKKSAGVARLTVKDKREVARHYIACDNPQETTQASRIAAMTSKSVIA